MAKFTDTNALVALILIITYSNTAYCLKLEDFTTVALLDWDGRLELIHRVSTLPKTAHMLWIPNDTLFIKHFCLHENPTENISIPPHGNTPSPMLLWSELRRLVNAVPSPFLSVSKMYGLIKSRAAVFTMVLCVSGPYGGHLLSI